MKTCAKCNTRVPDAYAADECPVCGAPFIYTRAQSIDNGIPWEHYSTKGVIPALSRTFYLALLKPRQLFTAVSRSCRTAMALLFGLLLGCIAGVGNYFSSAVFSPVEHLGRLFPAISSYTGGADNPVTYLIMLPIGVLAGILIESFYVHLMLLITASRKAPFNSTLRVICYTQAASLLAVLPAVGGLVSFFWGLYITVLGLRLLHNVSAVRIVIAIFLPLMLILGLFALIVTFILGTSLGVLLS